MVVYNMKGNADSLFDWWFCFINVDYIMINTVKIKSHIKSWIGDNLGCIFEIVRAINQIIDLRFL